MTDPTPTPTPVVPEYSNDLYSSIIKPEQSDFKTQFDSLLGNSNRSWYAAAIIAGLTTLAVAATSSVGAALDLNTAQSKLVSIVIVVETAAGALGAGISKLLETQVFDRQLEVSKANGIELGYFDYSKIVAPATMFKPANPAVVVVANEAKSNYVPPQPGGRGFS